jgi:hypothetical protein
MVPFSPPVLLLGQGHLDHNQGQAMVAVAEAARGQTTTNQKVAAKMFKILL